MKEREQVQGYLTCVTTAQSSVPAVQVLSDKPRSGQSTERPCCMWFVIGRQLERGWAGCFGVRSQVELQYDGVPAGSYTHARKEGQMRCTVVQYMYLELVVPCMRTHGLTACCGLCSLIPSRHAQECLPACTVPVLGHRSSSWCGVSMSSSRLHKIPPLPQPSLCARADPESVLPNFHHILAERANNCK